MELKSPRVFSWNINLRHSARAIIRSATLSAAIVLTAALGVGATIALFSIVDTVLLRPLPYPEPERLAQLWLHFAQGGREGVNVNHDGRTWTLLRDQQSVDAAVYKSAATGSNLYSASGALYVQEQRIGAGYFRVLGISPLLGREFTRDEDRPGGPAITILAESLWQSLFNRDPGILGRSVVLRGEPYTVVGVMPSALLQSIPVDVWTPLRVIGSDKRQNNAIIVRLRPGVTWPQAQAQIAGEGQAILGEMHMPASVKAEYRLIPLQKALSDESRRPLLFLLGLAILLLLICAFNISGLVLARTAARQREIATKVALGASRVTVGLQFALEAVFLSALGGLLGFAVGAAASRIASTVVPGSLGVWRTVPIDHRFVVNTIMVTSILACTFGLLAAVYAIRCDLSLAARDGAGISGGLHHRVRRLLVIGQMSVVTLLLVDSGLLTRSYFQLNSNRRGFDESGVVASGMPLNDRRFSRSEGVQRLFSDGISRLKAVPGVESVAVGSSLPYQSALNDRIEVLGSRAPSGQREQTNVVYVSPEYFNVLRMPILSGRGFSAFDRPDSNPVLIVNSAFVRRYLEGAEAVGAGVRMSRTVRAIVGVVGDVQQIPGWGTDSPIAVAPTVYLPVSQASDELLELAHQALQPSWVVRLGKYAPSAIIGSLDEAVKAAGPEFPPAYWQHLSDLRDKALTSERTRAFLAALLGVLALVISSVGLYGISIQTVIERSREVGIRVALGSTQLQVLRLCLSWSFRASLVGIVIGEIAAAIGASSIEKLVWGLSIRDPQTYVAVALFVFSVSLLGALPPALRAMKVDPAVVLRQD